jgi:hypothetical protein
MDIKQNINRIRGLLAEPKKEFVKILIEDRRKTFLFLQYVLPLLLLYALATYVGNVLFGAVTIREGSGVVLKSVIHIVLVQIITLYVGAMFINELLPFFHMPKNGRKAFALVAYSLFPVYLSMILAGLLPGLAKLINLAGLYSILLFWFGAETLIEMPQERRQMFVPLSLLIIILIYLAARIVLGAIFAL